MCSCNSSSSSHPASSSLLPIGRKRKRKILRLRRIVQNPATVFAAYDFFSSSDLSRGGSRHFHVTACTNPMLDGNNSGITFAFEEAFEATEQTLIDFSSQLGAFLG